MELAAVNAYATLCELNHCGRSGSYYPGEKACGVPPREDDNLAFRDIYLVDLGQELSEQQFDDAAETVSTYLFLDTATNAGQFFQACRQAEPRQPETRHMRAPSAHVRSASVQLPAGRHHGCGRGAPLPLRDRPLAHGNGRAGVELPVFKRSAASVSRSTDRRREMEYAAPDVSPRNGSWSPFDWTSTR